MKIQQITLSGTDYTEQLADLATVSANLIFAFGSVAHLQNPALAAALSTAFVDATILGCSTAGEIGPDGVSDDAVVISAIHLDHTGFVSTSTEIADMNDSTAAGARLASALQRDGLHNVLLLAPGVDVNGSALIEGFRSVLDTGVLLSGGLAADGGAFKQTWVLDNHGSSPRRAVALGIFDPAISVRHGTFHGWVPFGPERKVTRSDGNILFELDGEAALEVYKRYLGEHAKDLPASGLLFPFEMLSADRSGVGLIRTILGVDEAAGSLILAGDIITDGYLRLMHANTDSLVDGAEAAAEQIQGKVEGDNNAFALLVSCIGRKLVMGVRVDEEVEAVADIFGQHASITGFYSNGEISPVVDGIDCKLHNQTMTITYLTEA